MGMQEHEKMDRPSRADAPARIRSAEAECVSVELLEYRTFINNIITTTRNTSKIFKSL